MKTEERRWFWCEQHKQTSKDPDRCIAEDWENCSCVGTWATATEAENYGFCMKRRIEPEALSEPEASSTPPPAVYRVFASLFDREPCWWLYAGHGMWVRPDRLRGTKFFADQNNLTIIPNTHQDEGDLAFFNVG